MLKWSHRFEPGFGSQLIYLVGLWAFLHVAGPVWAADLHVQGIVEAEDGHPVLDATITLLEGPRRLTEPEPIINGRIDLHFAETVPAVRIKIEAAGYTPRNIQMVPQNGKVLLDKVILVPVPGVSINYVHHALEVEGDINRITFLARNAASDRLIITSVKLQGTKKKITDCYDLVTPEIIFVLDENVEIEAKDERQLPMTVESSKPLKVSTRSAAASVRLAPCDQATIDVTFPVMIGLDKSEEAYMAIRVPVVVSGHATKRKTVDLGSWDKLVVEIDWEEDGGKAKGHAFATRQ